MHGTIWDDIKLRVIQSNNSLIHIIAINIVAFLVTYIPLGFTLFFGREVFIRYYDLFADWMFLPGDFGKLLTRPWTLITYFFLHSFSLLHILFNMIWLWWFGRIYHGLMGNKRTIQLYIFAGIISGLVYMLGANFLPVLSKDIPLVGASGAVTGFIVAAAVLAPHYTIRLFFFGEIKIWVIAALSILMNIIPQATDNLGGALAHLAGGAAGYIFVTQLKKGRDLGSWITTIIDFFVAILKPRPKERFKVHQSKSSRPETKTKSTSSPNRVSQAEIDAVLEKIHKSGYDSLTAREREILFRASDKE